MCEGIAEQWRLEPTLVRLAFILLAFAWGLGVLLYLALWLLMPEQGARASSVEAAARQNIRIIRAELEHAPRRVSDAWHRTERSGWPRPLGRQWMAIGLVALGALVLLSSFGAFAWLTPARAVGVAAIVLGVAVIVGIRGGDR